MGQYYKCMVMGNDGKAAGIDSWAYNNGAKLMEHSYCGNGYVDAAIRMIGVSEFLNGGPVRVGWIGDYADAVLDEIEDPERRKVIETMYKAAWKYPEKEFVPAFDKTTLPHHEVPPDVDGKKLPLYNRFSSVAGILVNCEKGLFVRCPEWDGETWFIHPLPLLTAVGNGQGGGDYSGTDMELIGSWAGDHVSWVNPAEAERTITGLNLKEIEVHFKEE